MRVVIERIHGDPPHGLTTRDIKVAVRAVEAEFGRLPGLLVHLKATLPENTAFERPAIYSGYSHRLNVLCRGVPREKAIRQVLRELINIRTREHVHTGQLRSAEDWRAIDRMVATLLPKVMEALDEATS